MNPKEPLPVKLLAGILYSERPLLEHALILLNSEFGDIDYRSLPYPFTISGYYHPEMGETIERLFVSFSPLVSPSFLAEAKLRSNRIEEQLAIEGKRKVNIDTGYLDFDKMVLASAKYNGDKIYLSSGIYADLTLRYSKGGFSPYPWSFPDFQDGRYSGDILRIRSLYKHQLKKTRTG